MLFVINSEAKFEIMWVNLKKSQGDVLINGIPNKEWCFFQNLIKTFSKSIEKYPI